MVLPKEVFSATGAGDIQGEGQRRALGYSREKGHSAIGSPSGNTPQKEQYGKKVAGNKDFFPDLNSVWPPRREAAMRARKRPGLRSQRGESRVIPKHSVSPDGDAI
jgi:hypothetical protein